MNPEELARLTELEEKVAFADQHVQNAAKQVSQLDHLVVSLMDRLAVVERKTACLSDQPGRKNCPHCTKIISNLNVRQCPHCGYGLYE